MPPIIVVDWHSERRQAVDERCNLTWHLDLRRHGMRAPVALFTGGPLAFLHLGNSELLENDPPLLSEIVRKVLLEGGRIVCYTGGELPNKAATLIKEIGAATPAPQHQRRVALLQRNEIWNQEPAPLARFLDRLNAVNAAKTFEESWSFEHLFEFDSPLLVFYLLTTGLARIMKNPADQTKRSSRFGLAYCQQEALKAWWNPTLKLMRDRGETLQSLFRIEMAERGSWSEDQQVDIQNLARAVEALYLDNGGGPRSAEVFAADKVLREVFSISREQVR